MARPSNRPECRTALEGISQAARMLRRFLQALRELSLCYKAKHKSASPARLVLQTTFEPRPSFRILRSSERAQTSPPYHFLKATSPPGTGLLLRYISPAGCISFPA